MELKLNKNKINKNFNNYYNYNNHLSDNNFDNNNFNSKNNNFISNSTEFYLIYDDNSDNKDILGILHINKGKMESTLRYILFLFIYLEFTTAFKFSIISILDFFVLAKTNKNDYYLAEIAIDKSQRNKGIGTQVIKKAIEIAKFEGFKRVVLDVELTNIKAKELYESIGFKEFNKRKISLFNKERGMYNMEYVLR